MKMLDYVFIIIIALCVLFAIKFIIKTKGKCCGSCSDCKYKCLKKEKEL